MIGLPCGGQYDQHQVRDTGAKRDRITLILPLNVGTGAPRPALVQDINANEGLGRGAPLGFKILRQTQRNFRAWLRWYDGIKKTRDYPA